MSLEAQPKSKRGHFCLSTFILLSYGLSFQDERQGTNFVTTFDKEHYDLPAPHPTKLQMLVCRIHHYPSFPYQQGIFGFLLFFTFIPRIAHTNSTWHALKFSFWCVSVTVPGKETSKKQVIILL